MTRRTVGAVAVVAALAAWPSTATAHCDSMDGPVVRAARTAFLTDNVALALAWVRAEDEPEIRGAFDRAMAVRRMGGEAASLAEYWFFETLVRVHRAGEGAPFTGLKPAGHEPPAGIAAADGALERGSADALVGGLTDHVSAALRDRFERVHRLAGHDPTDVEAGRQYVRAYVEYVHFVEQLHALLEGGSEAHAEAGAVDDVHP